MTGNYIKVTMYDDRSEILSPDKLLNLVTVDNIQETRFSRNPQIANSTAIPKRSVERIIKSHKEKGIISRQGTKNGKWIIL